jgi:putative Holliday junction resolvase
MLEVMKYLGIDYGTKRIGVAVSDDTGSLAFPLAVVPAGPKAIQEIISLIRKNKAEMVVMGESRDFKGDANPIMEDIAQFKKDLEEISGVPVAYELEFFSSVSAARQYAPDGSRKENPSQDKLDAAAAAVILQSYLDKQKK